MSIKDESARCETCAYWYRGTPAAAHAIRSPTLSEGLGACHLHPPLPMPSGNEVSAYYPVTHQLRVCGAWEFAGKEEDGPGGGEEVPDAEVVVPFRSAA